MATHLALRGTTASDRLLPGAFASVLAKLGKGSEDTPIPQGTMHGQELRLSVDLPLTDDACAAFLLDFVGQGRQASGAAHGPSTELLAWAFHTLASSLGCTLVDVDHDQEVMPDAEPHREPAVAYLAAYEADVLTTRKKQGDDLGASFLRWLVREEHVALADGANEAALATDLPMRDAPALYEMLLDKDEVEDVFVSERELASLLSRFHARLAP